MLIGTSSREVKAQLNVTREENNKAGRTGMHTGKTTNPLNLRENYERKELPLRILTDGVKVCVPVVTGNLGRIQKKEDEQGTAGDGTGAKQTPPKATGQGTRSTSSGNGGIGTAPDGAPVRPPEGGSDVPKPSGKSKIKALDLKEPEHRKKLIAEIFALGNTNTRASTQRRGKRSVGAIDPNKREPAVGIIKVPDGTVSLMLNGEHDRFAYANRYLSDVDTEITEWVRNPNSGDTGFVRHVVMREVPPVPKAEDRDDKPPADRGLTMGRIVGFSSRHFCNKIRDNGPGHVCAHLQHSLRTSLHAPTVAEDPAARAPSADVEATNDDHECDDNCHRDHPPPPPPPSPPPPPPPGPPRAPGSLNDRQKIQQEQKDRQQERKSKLFPTPGNASGIPVELHRTDFWKQTGLLGPREDCEIVRRVSLDVYRRKANIVRNAKALEEELKAAKVNGTSATEWQRAIPTSQTTYLSTYITYIRYVLKGLAQIMSFYATSKLR